MTFWFGGIAISLAFLVICWLGDRPRR